MGTLHRNRDKSLIKHECRWVRIQLISFISSNACLGPTGRTLSFAQFTLVLHSICLARGRPKEGIPFIDDHIHTSDVIVDCLTAFSVIGRTFPSASLPVTKESPW